MKKLLMEVEHELHSLQGLYVTDKAEFAQQNPDCFWQLDHRDLLKRLSESCGGDSGP